MQSVKRFQVPTLVGAAALLLVAALAFTAAALYASPPDRQTVAFYTDDAASVRPGDVVRIAGVTVGKVKDLSIEQDRVKVRAMVERNAFVGKQSQVEVRMLTVVGGYYVNLISLGDEPLGNETISADRVTMPYSLIRTLTDATRITDDVSPKPIQESLDEIQQGLSGANVETLSAVIEAGNALASTLDRQRGQISRILTLSDEYIEALSRYRGRLQEMVSKVSILEQTLVLYGKGFGNALKGMGDVLEAIGPVGTFYSAHRDKFLEKVRNWQAIVRTWADRNGIIVRGLRHIRTKLERVLDAQNARPELLATDLCIPIPGSPC